jgi:hypothetical protein
MKFLIDLELDGYDSEQEMREACYEYIKDQLGSAGTYVTIIGDEDTMNLEISNVMEEY